MLSATLNSPQDERLKVGRSWYSRDTLRERTTYLNGKEHGLPEEFWESGLIKQRSSYRDGELHGVTALYDPKRNEGYLSIYKYGLLVDGFT